MAKNEVVSQFKKTMTANLLSNKYFPTCPKPSSMLPTELKKKMNAEYEVEAARCKALFMEDALSACGLLDQVPPEAEGIVLTLLTNLFILLPSNLERAIEDLDKYFSSLSFE